MATNAERFKTVEERTLEFNRVCKCDCENCKIFEMKNYQHNISCPFVWLEMEAEEEKPLPCPFCGSEVEIGHPPISSKYYIQCTKSGCVVKPITKSYNSKEEAIAAWNKRIS